MVDVKKICDVLQSEDFWRYSQRVNRTKLIEMANSVGPEMVLIHSKKIEKLGKIPKYSDGLWIKATDAIEKYKAPYVEIFMFSHRWLRASENSLLAHPDSEDNKKAAALSDFSKWRCKWVEEQHGFTPEIFYWIDYCCFDEGKMGEYFPMLPLWVSCCERFLSFRTPDYKERSWCRVEELLSYTFSFADHHTIIDESFRFCWPHTGKPFENVIQDPRTGKITNHEDRKYVSALTELALTCTNLHKIKGITLSQTSFGKVHMKSFKL